MYHVDEELNRLEKLARKQMPESAPHRSGNAIPWAAAIFGVALLISAAVLAWAIRTLPPSPGSAVIVATEAGTAPTVVPVASITLSLPSFKPGRACKDADYAIDESEKALLLERLGRYVCPTPAFNRVIVIGGHDYRELIGAARGRYGTNMKLSEARSHCAIEVIDKLLEESFPGCRPLSQREHITLVAVPSATHADAKFDELAEDRRAWVILTSDVGA